MSLEYKLVRSDPPPEESSRRSRKSRHDGRYVRPSDKFSCELADLSNRFGLSPVQESDIVPPPTVRARAIAHETRHQIPAGPFPSGETQSSMKKEVATSKSELVQHIPILTRRIRCVR